MTVQLTEEQFYTIYNALIDKFSKDLDNLCDYPDSKYFLAEFIKTKKAKDMIFDAYNNVKESEK